MALLQVWHILSVFRLPAALYYKHFWMLFTLVVHFERLWVSEIHFLIWCSFWIFKCVIMTVYLVGNKKKCLSSFQVCGHVTEFFVEDITKCFCFLFFTLHHTLKAFPSADKLNNDKLWKLKVFLMFSQTIAFWR